MELSQEDKLKKIRWRGVVGFEDRYEVSSIGVVRNKKRGNLLKPAILKSGKGYFYVSFYNAEKKKSEKYRIHRLVAKAFVKNLLGKEMVNHIDGDTFNNSFKNLEWVTASENVIHGFKNGRVPSNKGNMSKARALYLVKRYPRQAFWILRKDDFAAAKAMFGEEEITVTRDDGMIVSDQDIERLGKPSSIVMTLPAFQFHLQQAVISEDPISYYMEHLDG